MDTWYRKNTKTAFAPAAAPGATSSAPAVAAKPPAGTTVFDKTTSDADALAQLQATLRNTLRQNILPNFINAASNDIAGLIKRETDKLATLLRGNNIDLSRVDTRSFFTLVVNSVMSQYARTGNPNVTNAVMNSTAVEGFITGIVNAHTPTNQDMGQAALQRALNVNKPRNA